MLQREEDFPGLYVVVRCLGVICEFLGDNTEDFLLQNQLKCKKLSSKLKTLENRKKENKLAEFKQIMKNTNMFKMPSKLYFF